MTDTLTLAHDRKWAVVFSLIEDTLTKQPLIEVRITEWGEVTGDETYLTIDQAQQLRDWLAEREYPDFEDPATALTSALEKAIEAIDSEVLVSATNAELARLIAGAESMARFADLPFTFDLMWKADMRAIKAWQDAHPETEGMVWPDRANHITWLMDQWEAAKQQAEVNAGALRAPVAALIERVREYGFPVESDPSYAAEIDRVIASMTKKLP